MCLGEQAGTGDGCEAQRMEQKGDLSERVTVGGTRRAALSIADALWFFTSRPSLRFIKNNG